MTDTRYVFGPVPSRRLGRSLGVDLVGFKTCTYDCIYCQLGRTTNKTIDRHQWVPLDDVLAELKDKLSATCDYITLSGSGEPTLYSRVDELIAGIRSMTDIPIAVLTNGSLLWDQAVGAQLMNADLVIPSLDAGREAMFRAINRPHNEISFDRMLEGLIEFRREFRGQYWLEVFLLAGHNAITAEVEKLADCVNRIEPDRVQLNTTARPPAEDYAAAVQRTRLNELAGKKIGPCIACNICKEELTCGIDDDFGELIPVLADKGVVAVIIGTPVYFGSMTAQCKALLDRCVVFRRNGWLLRDKIAGVLAVGGVRHGGQELTLQTVMGVMLCHDMICVGDGQPTGHFGAALYSGGESGIETDEDGLETARNLGRRVAEVSLKLNGISRATS